MYADCWKISSVRPKDCTMLKGMMVQVLHEHADHINLTAKDISGNFVQTYDRRPRRQVVPSSSLAVV